jgi:hypothetical protein
VGRFARTCFRPKNLHALVVNGSPAGLLNRPLQVRVLSSTRPPTAGLAGSSSVDSSLPTTGSAVSRKEICHEMFCLWRTVSPGLGAPLQSRDAVLRVLLSLFSRLDEGAHSPEVGRLRFLRGSRTMRANSPGTGNELLQKDLVV